MYMCNEETSQSICIPFLHSDPYRSVRRGPFTDLEEKWECITCFLRDISFCSLLLDVLQVCHQPSLIVESLNSFRIW